MHAGLWGGDHQVCGCLHVYFRKRGEGARSDKGRVEGRHSASHREDTDYDESVCLVALCYAAFLQGIKFYDPEIVENTPEAVEYRGLQNVLDAVAEHLGYTQGKVWT